MGHIAEMRNPGRGKPAGARRVILKGCGGPQITETPNPRLGAPGRPAPSVARLAEHLVRLGSRPVAELLVELATLYGPGVIDVATGYQRLSPELIRALGADRFPPSLIAIDGGAR